MPAQPTNPVPVVIKANQQPLKSQAKWKRVIIALLALLYVISHSTSSRTGSPSSAGLTTSRARMGRAAGVFQAGCLACR